MKKIILMLLAMVLSGCATTVPMPKEDTQLPAGDGK
jgi:uncharacterized protein YceK